MALPYDIIAFIMGRLHCQGDMIMQVLAKNPVSQMPGMKNETRIFLQNTMNPHMRL